MLHRSRSRDQGGCPTDVVAASVTTEEAWEELEP